MKEAIGRHNCNTGTNYSWLVKRSKLGDNPLDLIDTVCFVIPAFAEAATRRQALIVNRAAGLFAIWGKAKECVID